VVQLANQQEVQKSGQIILFTNIIGVMLLSGFFLLGDKLLANYLVTNGFFLLIVLQPLIPKTIELFEYREVDSLEALFDKWKFTPTEKEVAFLLMEGSSTVEIAELKFIEEATVRKHISNLMSKANVNLRHEFVAKVQSMVDKTEV